MNLIYTLFLLLQSVSSFVLETPAPKAKRGDVLVCADGKCEVKHTIEIHSDHNHQEPTLTTTVPQAQPTTSTKTVTTTTTTTGVDGKEIVETVVAAVLVAGVIDALGEFIPLVETPVEPGEPEPGEPGDPEDPQDPDDPEEPTTTTSSPPDPSTTSEAPVCSLARTSWSEEEYEKRYSELLASASSSSSSTSTTTEPPPPSPTTTEPPSPPPVPTGFPYGLDTPDSTSNSVFCGNDMQGGDKLGTHNRDVYLQWIDRFCVQSKEFREYTSRKDPYSSIVYGPFDGFNVAITVRNIDNDEKCPKDVDGRYNQNAVNAMDVDSCKTILQSLVDNCDTGTTEKKKGGRWVHSCLTWEILAPKYGEKLPP